MRRLPCLYDNISPQIVNYIAKQISVPQTVNLKTYSSTTKQRHLDLIRSYLNINANRYARKQCMKKSAIAAAENKENTADIINHILDELIKSEFELPSFAQLSRLARAIKVVVNQKIYKQINQSLSETQQTLIHQLLSDTDDSIEQRNQLTWFSLKQEPKSQHKIISKTIWLTRKSY